MLLQNYVKICIINRSVPEKYFVQGFKTIDVRIHVELVRTGNNEKNIYKKLMEDKSDFSNMQSSASSKGMK